ncbi:MAG: hypothetical protein HY748_02120 [Elusimicrobia bacterium]|nr:hypothetical protein [Elusimicrobiota bacterium]
MKSARSIVASLLALCLVHSSAASASAFVAGALQTPLKQTVVSLDSAPQALTAASKKAPGQAVILPAAPLPAADGETPVQPQADEAAGLLPAALPVLAQQDGLLGQEVPAEEKPTTSETLALMGSDLKDEPSGSDLGRYYTGEKKLNGAADLVDLSAIAAPGPVSAPVGLAAGEPSTPASKQSEVPAPKKDAPAQDPNQAMLNPGIIVAIVAAVAAVGTGIYLWLRGKSKNDKWENSKSNQDIIALEKARRDNDPAPLAAMKTEARSRQKRMEERVAYAQSAGKKEVELSEGKTISVKEGKTYAAFDGLVAARAEMNENAVSKDASKRVGGELPSTWQQNLSGLESQAKSSEFEGSLALSLKSMQAELGRQDAALAQYVGDVTKFDENVPGLFGGRLKEMTKRGQADISEFRTSEIAPEKAAFEKFNGAMRGRVSGRLANRDAEYQGHLARLENLTGAAEGTLKSAVEMAQEADKAMQEMASHERSRAMYLLLASQNENVEVVDYDSQGRRIGSHYEDHSATYKALAASEGAAARASGATAQAQIKALSTIIPLLHKDPVLKAENLTFALPTQSNTRVGGQGGSVFFDFWLPASWNFFMTMFSESQALQARSAFAPVKGALESVLNEVNSRRKGEVVWTDKQIDKVLTGQMAKAPAEKK